MNVLASVSINVFLPDPASPSAVTTTVEMTSFLLAMVEEI